MSVSVMLAVQEKKTAAVDLYHPLRQYIATAYGEPEAQAVEDDLNDVRQLRLEVEKAAYGASEIRRQHLVSYYGALASIEPRFPISPNPAHVHSLTFTWFDAFKPSKKSAQQSIHLEKAAILFNVGAADTQIALSADRTNAAGLKKACNAFQNAAGAFAYLRDHVTAKDAANGGFTVDLSVECAGMLEKLMRAQAQECFFEKVIGDAKPPVLCSKVARQVGLYYGNAYAYLNAPPLNQHFDRGWISHVQLKAAQYNAEACYRYSLDLHERVEIAEEISRLRIAINALADAKKSSRGVTQLLLDSVNKLEANMNHKLERAIKENDRVYLMRIPEASSLSALPAASLVKSKSMAEVLDVEEGLFSSLVPDNNRKSFSMFTDMVDNFIRTQAEKLQQGSEIIRGKLKEMGLLDSIIQLEGNFSLPIDLKEDVQAVQIGGGPSGLEAELQQLRDLRSVTQDLLVQTEELLKKEVNEDVQFRTQFGTKWTRPQSSSLTKNLQERLNKFAANLKQAADSDAKIERAMSNNFSLIAILDVEPIESVLQRYSRLNEGDIVGAVKQTLRQLEDLGAQGASLEDTFKEMKRSDDDIRRKLMVSSGSQEDLSKEQSKYNKICSEMNQIIVAQEQLMLQIQVQSEEVSTVLEGSKFNREVDYTQISSAIAKYREIKENINEGLKFYVTLQDAITNVQQQCKDFVMTRNIECQEMIEDLQKQISDLNFSDGKVGFDYPCPPQSYPQSAPAQPQPRAGSSHHDPTYATAQQAPYQVPSAQCQTSEHPPSHGQPKPRLPWMAWAYYKASQLQQGSHPPRPYTLPPPYQGSYHRTQ